MKLICLVQPSTLIGSIIVSTKGGVTQNIQDYSITENKNNFKAMPF